MVTVVRTLAVINPPAFLLVQPGQAAWANLGMVIGESINEYKSLPKHLGGCGWRLG